MAKSITVPRITVDASAPTANADSTSGYNVGDQWFNTATSFFYICADNTDGAAVWTRPIGAT